MAVGGVAEGADQQVAHWAGELGRARKRFRTFWDNGDKVVDEYRLQRADGNDANSKDKYNILYSSTETTRPNLYAQTPSPRVVLRNVDTADDVARMSARLLEGCLKYIMQMEDLDELMSNAVEDYLLPGMGAAWVRYEAAVEGEGENASVLDEMVCMDYVYWQDFLTGVARTWKEVPWVARRLWLTKEKATKRFGKDKADMLTYAMREGQARDMDNPAETAEAWEIWNKENRTVYWYGEGLKALLDEKPDPLKLKGFFPCPKPLRAISNTRTLVPRAFYSQYKSQAETLNVMTKRVRLLSEALRVVGLYDGSNLKLADVLSPQAGNRMIAVDSWAMFAQSGGIQGVVQWLPITEVATVLKELLAAREVAKQEIYEITGFSDIVRGVSKASETLGAQNIKADWAGARVKQMQRKVQQFARDILSMAGELIAEHCAPETIAIFSGLQIPQQTDPQFQQKMSAFKACTDLLKTELRRISTIDVETDSTLLADDQQERQDRTQFLAAAGAFLQQAVPAMESTPQLGPLLGAMLMFVVRTFPSSRPIEEEFEKVQQVLQGQAQQPQDQDKDGKKAAAQAAAQQAQVDAQVKQQELQARQAENVAKAQADAQKENNRHMEKMAELQLKERELAIRERELGMASQTAATNAEVAREDANTRKFTAVHAAAIAEMTLNADDKAQAQELEQEYDQMAQDRQIAEDDRQAASDNAEADRQAAAEAAEEAAEGDQSPGGGDDA